MTKRKRIALWCLGIFTFAVFLTAGIAVGRLAKMLRAAKGEHTGSAGPAGIVQSLSDMQQIVADPAQGFDGQSRLTVLCMGIDDNWTNGDEVYTRNARTDTLFLLTMDLTTHKATMLSIPRDTYAHIAGTKDRYFKINEAYSTGGPQRAEATVAELLGVHPDHYMVLNVDATKKMVDTLGGVDVLVEHPMHYHDTWGHLNIDLQPGFQHLNGDQAVGFARYRHPDAGKKPTPEDGDDRRMYRQHVLLRAMIDKAKTFSNITQANALIDTGMSTIRTDLSRKQLFELAVIFHGVQQDDIRTASLPGDDFRGPKGEWFYRLNMDKAHAYVDWLVRGDESASRRLATVVVRNGTKAPGLAQRAVDWLKENGYTDARVGGNVAWPTVQLTGHEAPPVLTRSMILDTGVPNPDAPKDIATLLGLTSPAEARRPVKPNKMGWTPAAEVTVTLGQDYAGAVQASGALASPPTSSRDLATN